MFISQERFKADANDGEEDEALWYVPISYVTASNPDFGPDNLRPKDWIDKYTLTRGLVVPNTDQWIIINPDAKGFFRVLYDEPLTQLIEGQLQTNHRVVSIASRSQIIDDYFKSAASSKLSNKPIHSASLFMASLTCFVNFRIH